MTTNDEKIATAFKKMSIALDLESGRHGSFAANIGTAWISADQNNREKLELAFSEIFKKGENK